MGKFRGSLDIYDYFSCMLPWNEQREGATGKKRPPRFVCLCMSFPKSMVPIGTSAPTWMVIHLMSVFSIDRSSLRTRAVCLLTFPPPASSPVPSVERLLVRESADDMIVLPIPLTWVEDFIPLVLDPVLSGVTWIPGY